MPTKLHIDIETYSEVDLKKAGAFRYIEDASFEILLIAYAIDDGPVRVLDIYWEGRGTASPIPSEFYRAFKDPAVELHAHNASFERAAFARAGMPTPPERWHCSAAKAAYCGYPMKLSELSAALQLGEEHAKKAGTALINFYCKPRKATKGNPSTRNHPIDSPEKWEAFKTYCAWDVEAEREASRRLAVYPYPATERAVWVLDQKINERGVRLDMEFVEAARAAIGAHAEYIRAQLVNLTGLDNPGSVAQLKAWLLERGTRVASLDKAAVSELIAAAEDPEVLEAMQLRQSGAKSSTSKYNAMAAAVCADGRARGLFQYYGASRTGRWAGRLIQLQNLPQNHLDDLEDVRFLVNYSTPADLIALHGAKLSSLISQLIRTAIIPDAPGQVLAVADYSAVEARALAWIAGEAWRMDVFRTHGKIYEASAARMFGVPIETVTKGSELRQKGKIAELALGYGGGVGALEAMGGEAMGLNTATMQGLVTAWRRSNPAIVALWSELENCAVLAIKRRGKSTTPRLEARGIWFNYQYGALSLRLPSGRSLYYQEARLITNRFGGSAVGYKIAEKGHWTEVDTYGGKLTENLIQAVCRDMLAHGMLQLEGAGFDIVLHVHDEAAASVPAVTAEADLKRFCALMGAAPAWAAGMPLNADGFTTEFYKKD